MRGPATAAILYQPRTRTVTACCPHKNSWRQWNCKVWGVFCSQWMWVSATLALSSIYLTMETWRVMVLHRFVCFFSPTFFHCFFQICDHHGPIIHLSGRWWDDHGLGILQRPPAVERTSTCHWHGTLAAKNQGFGKRFLLYQDTGCIRMSCLSHPIPKARSFLERHVVSFVQWPLAPCFVEVVLQHENAKLLKDALLQLSSQHSIGPQRNSRQVKVQTRQGQTRLTKKQQQ